MVLLLDGLNISKIVRCWIRFLHYKKFILTLGYNKLKCTLGNHGDQKATNNFSTILGIENSKKINICLSINI